MLYIFMVLFVQYASFAGSASQVSITWTYENFPAKIELYGVTHEKAAHISETKVVNTLKDAPVTNDLKGVLTARTNGSTPAVLVIRNNEKKDLYFFAVPHELNPHHASAGHYFECLCVGRVFKVPAGKVLYRIVRLNLNKSFQGLKKFTINHHIVGISETEANTTYKDRLRNDD